MNCPMDFIEDIKNEMIRLNIKHLVISLEKNSYTKELELRDFDIESTEDEEDTDSDFEEVQTEEDTEEDTEEEDLSD